MAKCGGKLPRFSTCLKDETKMKKFLFTFLLILSSKFGFAFSQQDLIALLQKPQNIQGDFTQQHFLKSLSKPIVSQGKFVLSANNGLLWQMQQPFAVDLRVKKDGITQWDGHQWMANNKLGQSEQINLFLGLLSGDVSALSAQFDLQLIGSAQQWQLILTPSSLLMKQIFNHIHIKGDELVREIELNEKQGDRKRILLHKIQTDQPLSDFAQRALQ